MPLGGEEQGGGERQGEDAQRNRRVESCGVYDNAERTVRACVTLGKLQAGLPELIEGVTGGEVRSLARALSLVESRAPGADELLARLYERGERSVRIGVTGARVQARARWSTAW
ncbi:MAG: hypothetical protein R2724_30545 [Bryobacterales bacterium]